MEEKDVLIRKSDAVKAIDRILDGDRPEGSTMNDKELKPCPFCGGVARLREYRTFDAQIHGMVTKYYVQCEACRIEVPTLGYGSDSKATEAWNRRAKDPKEILEKLPAVQPEPPWIPCSKKLPD